MRYRVLLVGLGRIGMGYDFELPSRLVLSLARAFTEHSRFDLIGGVDPDPLKRAAFETAYRRSAYASLEAALGESPDVVALAVPTHAHAEQLEAVLGYGSPLAILCEKPLAYDLSEAQGMLAACDSRGIRMFVNYFRRSEPGALEVCRRIQAESIAGPLKGVAWYSKGFLHNGSHLFDLLSFWLGPMIDATMLDAGRRVDVHDAEPDVRVRFERGTILFLAACHEQFSYLAIELLAINGRLRYDRGGEIVEWSPRGERSPDTGNRELTDEPEVLPTGMDRYQWHVANQLAAALDGAAADICTGAEALATLQSMTTIMRMRTP